jgi:hypothetical protein
MDFAMDLVPADCGTLGPELLNDVELETAAGGQSNNYMLPYGLAYLIGAVIYAMTLTPPPYNGMDPTTLFD